MSTNDETNISLYDQIIQELLKTLRDSDLFRSAHVDEVRKLAQSRRLHRPEAVVELLREPEP